MRAVVFVAALALCALASEEPALKQEIVDAVNGDATSSWRASMEQPHFAGRPLSFARGLCGAKLRGGPEVPEKRFAAEELTSIPQTFDSQAAWPHCPSISLIRDQSACGSCWAFGAAEAMSDRQCIKNNIQVNVSAADLMECCFTCGNGCDGGYPGAAWGWWAVMGLVDNGCAPYPFPSCSHHVTSPEPPCPSKIYQTPPCAARCKAGSGEQWSSDKKYGATHYAISQGVEAIQKEIMTHGPVETAFTVYEDFITYKSGVYVHKTGNILGGHAVKFVGWGTENGVPYWKVANSWNKYWGDNGYFKIIRGQNECGIESTVWGGEPKPVNDVATTIVV